MAELHVVGQILGAVGFPSQNLFCKVRLLTLFTTPAPSLHSTLLTYLPRRPSPQAELFPVYIPARSGAW